MLDWRQFWSLFSVRIEREIGLTDPEKVSCLEEAMYEGDYDAVVKTLQHRYDRHKLVYRHHVKQVHGLTQISDDYGSYIQFKDIVIKHHHGMQASCGESYDQLYTAILEALLPRTASALWSQHTAKNPHPPTLKEFLAFLDRRIESTETLSNTNKRPLSSNDRHPPTQSSNYQASKPRPKERSNPKTFHLREAKTETCPVCDSNHSIYQCGNFKEWSPEKRHGLARRKHLCFNCLSSNHSIESCPSRHTCRECHQKHHTLLHRFPAPPPTDTPKVHHIALLSSYTPPEPVAILPVGQESQSINLHIQTETGEPDLTAAQFPVTARATVSSSAMSKQALVFMDTGSAITLVTSRVANAIKAPKIKVRKVIRGMQDLTVAHSCPSHS